MPTLTPVRISADAQPAESLPAAQLPYLLDDDEAPPGPLDADDPPLAPPVLEDDPPDEEPLLGELPMLPEPELVVPPELDDEASEGELGVEDDDDDEPPGTTIVSFSFVVLEVDESLGVVLLVPPGITVVVSFFSHADNANAPASTNT